MNMPIDGDTPIQRAPRKKVRKPYKKTGNPPGRPAREAAERAAAEAEARIRLAEANAAPIRRNNPRRDLQPRQTREMARETTRSDAAVVTGRDGEVLTRRRINNPGSDPYEIPVNEIPVGWTYQWNRVSVLNQELINDQVQMHENGWRPVPAERHPGRWFKPGTTGAIVLNGLRLEERPAALTHEAVEEGKMVARKQMRDQTDALKLTQKLPEGFSDAKQYRGVGAHGSVQMKIDPTLDLPAAGGYELAEE
jgi:hypothetical protein